MNENFTSLLFFTILSQSAVGTLIFRELILLRGGFEFISYQFRRRSLRVIVILLFLSLVIAFLHPGNPLHAFNAINNFGKSWLSREIFSLSLLMAALLLYLIIELRNKHIRTQRIISFISIMLSISFVYSMIKLYMIPSVISWNNPFTPVSFIITTFLCGLILLPVIIRKNFDGFNSIITLLTAILLICSLVNSILFYGTFLKQVYYLFIIRSALTIMSLLIITALNLRFQLNKTGIWWVILSLIVVVSEIINRYIFFLSFEKSGL